MRDEIGRAASESCRDTRATACASLLSKQQQTGAQPLPRHP